MPHDFVMGAFLLDARDETRATSLGIATHHLVRQTLLGHEDVPQGALLIAGEFDTWHFLLARGSIVYLVRRGSRELSIFPREMLKGAFVQEIRELNEDLQTALKKAQWHWAIQDFKQQFLGNKKSPALWQLSRFYQWASEWPVSRCQVTW